MGLDEKVSKKEVQKINTFSLPVPSSATSFDLPDPVCAPNLVVIEDDDEDVRSKNLVSSCYTKGLVHQFSASFLPNHQIQGCQID